MVKREKNNLAFVNDSDHSCVEVYSAEWWWCLLGNEVCRSLNHDDLLEMIKSNGKIVHSSIYSSDLPALKIVHTSHNLTVVCYQNGEFEIYWSDKEVSGASK